jgi:NO-binding membrane sensor protein with MHYT domain
MNYEVIIAQWDPGLVALSFAVSALGAFAALSTAPAIRRGDGRLSWFNLSVTGIALGGVGIWAMHFIGMLAYRLPIGVGYGIAETAVSLLAAALVSAAALGYIASAPFSWRRLAVAGPLAGVGVALMHYLGMYGMRFGGFIEWDLLRVGLSLGVAILAATAALWLAFHVRGLGPRLGASVVMAGAVGSMHYTGMSAATIVCTVADRSAIPPGTLHPLELPMTVTLVALICVMLILFDQFMQRLTPPEMPRSAR